MKKSGVLGSLFRGLFWPFGVVVRAAFAAWLGVASGANSAPLTQVRAFRGFWWALGFPRPQDEAVITSPGRQNLAGRKRLRRVTRLLLAMLPRRLQSALGYPVSSTIGRSLSPGTARGP